MFRSIPYQDSPIEDWEIHRLPQVIRKALSILFPDSDPLDKLIGKSPKNVPPPLKDILKESRFRDFCIRSEKVRRVDPRPESDPIEIQKEIEFYSERTLHVNRNLAAIEEELLGRALRKLGKASPNKPKPSMKSFLDWCQEKEVL